MILINETIKNWKRKLRKTEEDGCRWVGIKICMCEGDDWQWKRGIVSLRFHLAYSFNFFQINNGGSREAQIGHFVCRNFCQQCFRCLFRRGTLHFFHPIFLTVFQILDHLLIFVITLLNFRYWTLQLLCWEVCGYSIFV